MYITYFIHIIINKYEGHTCCSLSCISGVYCSGVLCGLRYGGMSAVDVLRIDSIGFLNKVHLVGDKTLISEALFVSFWPKGCVQLSKKNFKT
jgi:hypothetical protein